MSNQGAEERCVRTAEKHELAVLIRAGNRLLSLETRDEPKACKLFDHVHRELARPLFQWSAASGLSRRDLDMEPPGGGDDPEGVLRCIRERRDQSIFLLVDFHPYLDNPVHVRLLREIAGDPDPNAPTVVLISPELELPRELRPLAARFELSPPTPEELEHMIREEGSRWAEQQGDGRRVTASRRAFDRLITNLEGLPMKDARRLARNAIHHDGALTEDDLPRVMEAKFELLDPGGVLSFEMETERFANVAGLPNLQRWLEQRARVFSAPEPPPGLDMPRGALLLGVQGCGKSLAARAAAGLFGVPLLHLDCGALFNKYHGETERNLRESLNASGLMAPCVLWIDEIEKGLSTSDSDGGTSGRVLGTFLTWMAEREERVFLVATANDVTSLPPELMRKGRFDEIFFVDLPDARARAEILGIHLQNREQDPAHFDLAGLAAAAEGFSGAELEQAVVSALYEAFSTGETLSDHHLRKELQNTRPLSVVRAEEVARLRQWAEERTVRA